MVEWAVPMKPMRCFISMSPKRFFSCPIRISTEPPVTKPLIRDCERKRTR